MSSSIIWAGFVASLLAGLATGLGALPIVRIGEPNERQQGVLLGFAAGVMLAASFFSLIIPGIAQAERLGSGRFAASAIVAAAVLLGGAALALLNRAVPPADRLGRGEGDAARFHRVWLFVAAITLHNLPEGLAVGVSFGGSDPGAGHATALGIGIQNIPEGLAVAGALASIGYSRGVAVLGSLASGLVEPVAALLGLAVIGVARPLLPWGLGFAAGAMIYIVVREIIPDTQARPGAGGLATASLMAGLAAMLVLDTALG